MTFLFLPSLAISVPIVSCRRLFDWNNFQPFRTKPFIRPCFLEALLHFQFPAPFSLNEGWTDRLDSFVLWRQVLTVLYAIAYAFEQYNTSEDVRGREGRKDRRPLLWVVQWSTSAGVTIDIHGLCYLITLVWCILNYRLIQIEKLNWIADA